MGAQESLPRFLRGAGDGSGPLPVPPPARCRRLLDTALWPDERRSASGPLTAPSGGSAHAPPTIPSVAEDGRARASADRPGGRFVQETFRLEPHENGHLLRHIGTGRPLSVAADALKVADGNGEIRDRGPYAPDPARPPGAPSARPARPDRRRAAGLRSGPRRSPLRSCGGQALGVGLRDRERPHARRPGRGGPRATPFGLRPSPEPAAGDNGSLVAHGSGSGQMVEALHSLSDP